MSDYRALDRTATSQFGLLTIRQAHKFGFSNRRIQNRVRDGTWYRYNRFVLAMPGCYPPWERALSAATLAGLTRGICSASHRSAARLLGLRTVDDDVEVSIRYPRHLKLEGVTVHRLRDLCERDVTYVNGIVCTTLVRTICDLGLTFPPSEVDRILRHAIATELLTRREAWELRYRLSRQGRNGVGVLAELLGDLPAGAEQAESGIEVLFLQMCERSGLPAPAMQLPVVINSRRYRLDFAYPLHRVFIEVDGAATHSESEQIANDDGRQNALVADGWKPLRFTYGQLKDHPTRCAAAVRSLLATASKDL